MSAGVHARSGSGKEGATGDGDGSAGGFVGSTGVGAVSASDADSLAAGKEWSAGVVAGSAGGNAGLTDDVDGSDIEGSSGVGAGSDDGNKGSAYDRAGSAGGNAGSAGGNAGLASAGDGSAGGIVGSAGVGAGSAGGNAGSASAGDGSAGGIVCSAGVGAGSAGGNEGSAVDDDGSASGGKGLTDNDVESECVGFLLAQSLELMFSTYCTSFDGPSLVLSMFRGSIGKSPDFQKPCAAFVRVVTDSHAFLKTPGKPFFVSASPICCSCQARTSFFQALFIGAKNPTSHACIV